jgi:hypothetical protein
MNCFRRHATTPPGKQQTESKPIMAVSKPGYGQCGV